MYRAVTWAALEEGVRIADERTVTLLAESLCIDLTAPTIEDGRKYTVFVDGIDVTWGIRTAEVDANVSAVAAYSGVRSALVPQQRRIAIGGPVVMIGRDITTIVLPDADLKVYLDATVDERARRRWRESQARGIRATYGDVLAAMRRRDDIDSHREVSPLRVAADAVVIDTTDMTIEAVVDRLLALIEERGCPPD